MHIKVFEALPSCKLENVTREFHSSKLNVARCSVSTSNVASAQDDEREEKLDHNSFQWSLKRFQGIMRKAALEFWSFVRKR